MDNRMPTSKKQLTANRRNAKKSTGPKTPEGKTISSRNAIKHGLDTHDIIINTPAIREDKAEYELLLSSLINELQPEGLFQQYLVRKIANCLWRSRRAVIAETARINHQLKGIDDDLRWAALLKSPPDDDDESPDNSETPENEPQNRSDMIGMRSIPDLHASFNILRYEMRLDRQLSRAYRLLRLLQIQRQAESLQEKWNKNKK
jgi:hypothetical protein